MRLASHQPPDARHAVVVGLDHSGLRRAAGFDGVRVDGALAEDPVLIEQVAGLHALLLHPHELLADDPPLLFRVARPRPAPPRKRLLASSTVEGAAAVAENAAHEIRLALAHQAGIHVNAARAVRAQRAQAEGECHRGIDAAADKEEHVPAAATSRILSSMRGTLCFGFQSLRQPQTRNRKFDEDLLALVRVHHFGWN